MKKDRESFVTDGPFLYRCADGNISGNWTVDTAPLSAENGGHGMIFRDFAGNLYFTMHTPNKATLERPVILPIAETGHTLTLAEKA